MVNRYKSITVCFVEQLNRAPIGWIVNRTIANLPLYLVRRTPVSNQTDRVGQPRTQVDWILKLFFCKQLIKWFFLFGTFSGNDVQAIYFLAPNPKRRFACNPTSVKGNCPWSTEKVFAKSTNCQPRTRGPWINLQICRLFADLAWKCCLTNRRTLEITPWRENHRVLLGQLHSVVDSSLWSTTRNNIWQWMICDKAKIENENELLRGAI